MKIIKELVMTNAAPNKVRILGTSLQMKNHFMDLHQKLPIWWQEKFNKQKFGRVFKKSQILPKEINPNKKYYDPRKWIRDGELTFKERLKKSFNDLNNINTIR